MKKTWILPLVSLMSMALFTGCASNADTMPQTSPTTSTAPMATTAPTNTAGPTVSIAPQSTAGGTMAPEMTTGLMDEGGVNTVEDALRVSDRVDDEVEKLSEIDSAEAIVAGNIALVGVSYDSQYQGGMTSRVEEMVTERVEMIDKAITSVHVTDEEDAVTKIANLKEKLKAGDMTFEQLQTQVLDIGSSIAGGGTPQVTQPQSNTGA